MAGLLNSCPQEHVDSWPFCEGLTMDDLQIAWRPLDELIPYARNPRTHTDAQVAQITASIKEFGWTNPVLVDGANGIIAGHGWVLAARRLGRDRVPVIELAHMSEAQKRAYVLTDNQLALNAGWDEALLRIELADLSDLGFDLGLIGFADGELERLLSGDKVGLTEDDDAPALPEQAVTRPGDLWVLGEHRLLCGNATVLADIERVLGGQLVDMTWTDPPYNVDYANSPKTSSPGVSTGRSSTTISAAASRRSCTTPAPTSSRSPRAPATSA
jgi:hypothetical protein